MVKFIKNNFARLILLISPLLLNVVLFGLINISLGNGFINVSDSAIFINKIEANKKFFSLWFENNLGYMNAAFVGLNFFSSLISYILLLLNLSTKNIELVIYFIAYTSIFYSTLFAFYLIQRRFWGCAYYHCIMFIFFLILCTIYEKPLERIDF